MVAHALNPLRRQWQAGFCESQAGLIYIASFRPARATQGDPV